MAPDLAPEGIADQVSPTRRQDSQVEAVDRQDQATEAESLVLGQDQADRQD